MSWTFRVSLTNVLVTPRVDADEQPDDAHPRSADPTETEVEDSSQSHDAFWERFVDASELHPDGKAMQRGPWQPFLRVYFDGMEKELPLRLVRGAGATALRDSSATLSLSPTRRSVNSHNVDVSSMMAVAAKDLFFSYSIEARSAADLAATLARRTAALYVVLQRTPAATPAPASPAANGSSPLPQLRQNGVAADEQGGVGCEVLVLASATIPLLDLAVAADDHFFFSVYAVSAAASRADAAGTADSMRVQRSGRPRGCVSVALRMEEEEEVTLQPRMLCVRGLHVTSAEYQVRYGWQPNPALALGTREKRAQASRSRESSPSHPSPHPSPIRPPASRSGDDAAEHRGSARAPSEEGTVTFRMGQLPPLQLTCSRAALQVQQIFFEVLTHSAETSGAGQVDSQDSRDATEGAGVVLVAARGQLALHQFLAAAHHDAEAGGPFTVSCQGCAAAGAASRRCLIAGILELSGIAHIRFELERQAATACRRDAAPLGVEASSPVLSSDPIAWNPVEVSSMLSSFTGDPLTTPPQSLQRFQERIVLVYPKQSAPTPTPPASPLLPNARLRAPLAGADHPAKVAAAATARHRQLSPFDSPLARPPAHRHPSDRSTDTQNSASGSSNDAREALRLRGESEERAAVLGDPSLANGVSRSGEASNAVVACQLGRYSSHHQELVAVDSGPTAVASSAFTAFAAEVTEEPSTSRAPPNTPPQPSASQLSPELSQGCSSSPVAALPVRANATATVGPMAGDTVPASPKVQTRSATEVPPSTRSGGSARGHPATGVVAAGSHSAVSSEGSTLPPGQPPNVSQHSNGLASARDEEQRDHEPSDRLFTFQRRDSSDSEHTTVPVSAPSTRRTAATDDTPREGQPRRSATLKPPSSAPTTQLDIAAPSGTPQPSSARGGSGGGGGPRRRSISVDPALVLHFSDSTAAPDATELAYRSASRFSLSSINTADSPVVAPLSEGRRQSDGGASGPPPERSLSHHSAGSVTPGRDLLGHPSVSVLFRFLAPPPPPPAQPLLDAVHPPRIPHTETQQARVVAAQLSAQYRTLLRFYTDKVARLASAEERARGAAAAGAQATGEREEARLADGHGGAAWLERSVQETAAKQQAAQECQRRAAALQRRLRDRQAEQQRLEVRLHAKEEALASAEEELKLMLTHLVQQRQTLDQKGAASQTADFEASDQLGDGAAARTAPVNLAEPLSGLDAREPQQSAVPATVSLAAQQHQTSQPRPQEEPPVEGADEVRQSRELHTREAAEGQHCGRVVVLSADLASSGCTGSHTSALGSQPEQRRLFETPVSPSLPSTGRPASSAASPTHGLPQAHPAGVTPFLEGLLLPSNLDPRKEEAVASPPLSTPPVYTRPQPAPPPASSVNQSASLEHANRCSVDAVAPPSSPFLPAHASLTDVKGRGLQSLATAPQIASLSRIEQETLRDGIDKSDRSLVLHLLHTKPQLFLADNNLLHVACAATLPDLVIVEALLKARPELASGVDANTGNTVLHVACAARYPSASIVKRLILAGTPVHTRNRSGLTPFHVCLLNPADTPLHRIKDTLLSIGSSSVNERTADGRTPLHLVCTADYMLPLVRYLALRGADLSARSRCVDPVMRFAEDVTAVQVSRLHRAEAVVRYLQQAAVEVPYAHR